MPYTPDITLLIADAQHLFRDGLKLLLQQEHNIRLVAEADDRKTLFLALQEHQPDVVIIDYDLPEYFNYQDVATILQHSPDSKVLVISSDHDQLTIYQVLEFGVKSYITKECSKEEIVRAIYATARGKKFFCNKVLDVLLDKTLPHKKVDDKTILLSEREREIVRSIAEGKTSNAVAEEFSISIHTVRTHRKNIMRKLGIRSLSELVLYAVQAGMVEAKP